MLIANIKLNFNGSSSADPQMPFIHRFRLVGALNYGRLILDKSFVSVVDFLTEVNIINDVIESFFLEYSYRKKQS